MDTGHLLIVSWRLVCLDRTYFAETENWKAENTVAK